MYLLDTNVVSELRRTKPHGAVLKWIDSVRPQDLFVSAVTMGELQAGIEVTRGRDRDKANEIERWIDQLPERFAVLPLGAEAFRQWAQLMHGKSDAHMMDAMIAAIALVHGLTVVSRNARDFTQFRVALLNPFATR